MATVMNVSTSSAPATAKEIFSGTTVDVAVGFGALVVLNGIGVRGHGRHPPVSG